MKKKKHNRWLQKGGDKQKSRWHKPLFAVLHTHLNLSQVQDTLKKKKQVQACRKSEEATVYQIKNEDYIWIKSAAFVYLCSQIYSLQSRRVYWSVLEPPMNTKPIEKGTSRLTFGLSKQQLGWILMSKGSRGTAPSRLVQFLPENLW